MIVKSPNSVLPDSFFLRLIAFYRKQPSYFPRLSPIWVGVTKVHQDPLVTALDTGDLAKLKETLTHLYTLRIIYGLDSSIKGLLAFDPKLHTSDVYISGFSQLLRAVENNLGISPVINPEQIVPCPLDIEGGISAIEEKMEISLTHPGCGDVSGLEVGSRFIPHKLLDAALTLVTARRQMGWPPVHLLEIGAGAGWIGYLANQRDVLYYHTVDLPIAAVIQAYMLAGATSPDRVWLEGESLTPNETPPAFYIHGMAENTDWRWVEGFCTFAINQNSFPEITVSEQERLVALLSRLLKPKAGTFLSINHESSNLGQQRVFVVLSKSPDFCLVQRSPHWARAGYIEEVWRRL